MKAWYTARELAELRLPGLPETESATIRRAKRDGWGTRERKGRGGGSEYSFDSLPESARAELTLREMKPTTSTSTTEIVQRQLDEEQRDAERKLKASLAIKESSKPRAMARLRVLEHCERWLERARLPRDRGTEIFATEYNQRRFEVDQSTRELVQRVDRATLYRWRQRHGRDGLAGLVDNRGQWKLGKSKVESNPELRGLLLGLLADNPRIQPKHAHEYLTATRSDLACLLSTKAIERFYRRWTRENASLFCHMRSPDEWKNKFMPAFGDAGGGVERLNQLWEMDSTPADLMLADGRHVLVGVIDVFSRRARLLVSRASRAQSVCLTFRKAALAWGMPEAVRTDNGQDYVSTQFRTALQCLGVAQVLCIPFASEQKPFIERFFQTFSHDLVELKPTYIGHSVAEREAIRARESFAKRIMGEHEVPLNVTAAELQEFADQWCEFMYQRNQHSGLGGKTPWQVAAEWQGPVRRVQDERALDLLLTQQAEIRHVGKKGIRVDNSIYQSADLVDEQRVQVRLDDNDMGRIYVYSEDGSRFITVAEDKELLGARRSELAAAVKAKTKRLISEQRAELGKLRKKLVGDKAQTILEHRVAQERGLVELPRPSEPYTTPQLEAASAAVRALDNWNKPAQHDEEMVADGTRILAELKAAPRWTQQDEDREIEELLQKFLAMEDGKLEPEMEWVQSYLRAGSTHTALAMWLEDRGDLYHADEAQRGRYRFRDRLKVRHLDQDEGMVMTATSAVAG